MRRKRILVAPINWGLGHATRCIPLIRELEKKGFEPVLASDQQALLLLQEEFPNLRSYTLPPYNITYSQKGSGLKWKLLRDSPHILKTIRRENAVTEELVRKERLQGIISDNRFGVHYPHLRNVFITHQLNVLSGRTTFLSSRIHRNYIRKFDQCWVPDSPGKRNLSGLLGHPRQIPDNVKYIGLLSRFQKKKLPLEYEITVLLSGPEPQRGRLEAILMKELRGCDKKVLFLRGVVGPNPQTLQQDNITVRDYLSGTDLEHALNSSQIVISRSGYTTLMDLSRLGKKAFFIPTPGQYEQEYLAGRMMNMGMAPFCDQEEFCLKKLEELKNYSGLKDINFVGDSAALFSIFEG